MSSGRRSQALSGVGRGPRSTPDNSGACAHSALRSIISSDSAASWMCRRQVYASRHSMSSSTSACSRFSSATDDGSEYSAARTSPMSLSISQIHGIVHARRDHADRNFPALRTVPALPMVTSMDAAVTRNQGEAGPVLMLPSPRELRGRTVHQANLAALARPCEDHHIVAVVAWTACFGNSEVDGMGIFRFRFARPMLAWELFGASRRFPQTASSAAPAPASCFSHIQAVSSLMVAFVSPLGSTSYGQHNPVRRRETYCSRCSHHRSRKCCVPSSPAPPQRNILSSHSPENRPRDLFPYLFGMHSLADDEAAAVDPRHLPRLLQGVRRVAGGEEPGELTT